MTRVLVIGAAGVFGSRLAEGLVGAGFSVTVAGRDLDRAAAAARRLRERFPGADVDAVALDTRTLTPDALRATGASIVTDAAGPFQSAQPRVAAAAIAAGLHYVDLADARDFVAAFPALDAAACAAGVVALTGCSSTPALSNAVLDRLTDGWREIVAIEADISPGARAPRGASVLRAVLSWLGRPVRVFERGGWTERRGWSGGVTRTIGHAGRRRLALAETPDLDLFVARFAPRDRAVFRAGLEPAALHLATSALALIPRLTGAELRPLARALATLSRAFAAFGSDRGAMLVEALGVDGEGRAVRAAWTLVAPPGVGPVTPSLPALAAIRAIARGEVAPGARACVGVLPVEALEAELAVHAIETTVAHERAAIFARAIGPAFDTLPPALRALHEAVGPSVWRGEAVTEGAANLAAAAVARAFGFPPAQPRAPVVVEIDADGRRSIWRRRIGRARFRSVLSRPAPGGHVEERFGPLTMRLSLSPEGGRLIYRVEGWRLGPLPLPRALAPRTTTFEAVDAQARFTFDVEIGVVGLGRLVRYAGWLVPEDAA